MAEAYQQEPRRRGRPKGTGINDTAILGRINALMAANAALKPTTAIKQAGVTDPSIVRRLREKLKPNTSDTPLPGSITTSSSRQRTTPRQKPATSVVLKKQSAARLPSAAASPSSLTTKQIKPLPQRTEPEAKSPPEQTQPRDPMKEREIALLAAYLKALQATAVPSLEDELAASTKPLHASISSPATAAPQSPAQSQTEVAPPQPADPRPQAPASQPPGMMFPFMPPFLQPFMPKSTAPDPIVQKQAEALKLSVEVMTAVTRLQLFAYQSTIAATPLGNMLQAQSMMGQMLLASFAGFAQGTNKLPDKK